MRKPKKKRKATVLNESINKEGFIASRVRDAKVNDCFSKTSKNKQHVNHEQRVEISPESRNSPQKIQEKDEDVKNHHVIRID